MTTDLSQMYLQDVPKNVVDAPEDVSPHDLRSSDASGDSRPDFPTVKSGYSTACWIAAGAGVLIATGAAAFASFRQAPEPSSDLAHAAVVLPTESESVEHAVFGEESSEAFATDEVEADAPAPAAPARVANPVDANAPSPAAEQDSAPETGEPPAADAFMPAQPGAFYVQLASYRTKETADAHARTLAARGLLAQSTAYGGPAAGWWHAVRLGPFPDRVAAEKSRFDLDLADRRTAYVLPRSNGKFHVQVASFAERGEAEQVAKSFTANGHATKVTRVKMSGSYWHCVRIGPFDTREEAVAYKALVPDVAGSQSTVIPFPPPPVR